MSECIKYCGQCNKTDLPNIRDKEPVHIGYPYAYKTDCEGDAYIKAEEVKNLIEQARADEIDELKMLFKLSISEKPNRTINECEAEIIFRNLKKQIKEQNNE